MLEDKKIFFGHQSVGLNILDGIRDVGFLDKYPDFKIIETKNATDIFNPGIAHACVGVNRDPISKIDEFISVLSSGVGSKVDIAFLKLCYVDFSIETDVQQLLRYYVKAMKKLSESFPNLKLVHLTAPLAVNLATWKTKIKQLTGKGTLWEYQDNIVRNQFSDLLVQEYLGSQSVFDIAKYEATYENGKIHIFRDQKKTYSSMILEYTLDSGHLNNRGSKWVASNLLTFLNGLEFD